MLGEWRFNDFLASNLHAPSQLPDAKQSGLSNAHRAMVDCYQAFLQSLFQAQEPCKMALAQVYQTKADLARSYYELGVTYYVIGNQQKSYESFEQVDRLLSELEAVPQVDQVKCIYDQVKCI